MGCILYALVDFKPRITNTKKIIEEEGKQYGTQ